MSATINICIKEDELPLLSYEENGTIIEKYVSPEQLLISLGQYMKENAIFKSPALPKGTVLYQQTTRGDYIVMEFDPVCVPVRFHKAVIENVHFPKLLFAFYVQDKHVGEVYIAAVKDHEITDQTEVYEYPFSNVSSNKACWSELPIRIESLTELSRIPYQWFGSENTSCYYGQNNLSKLDYRAYLEHNANREEFDYSTLKPSHLTFTEWASSLLNSDEE